MTELTASELGLNLVEAIALLEDHVDVLAVGTKLGPIEARPTAIVTRGKIGNNETLTQMYSGEAFKEVARRTAADALTAWQQSREAGATVQTKAAASIGVYESELNPEVVVEVAIYPID